MCPTSNQFLHYCSWEVDAAKMAAAKQLALSLRTVLQKPEDHVHLSEAGRANPHLRFTGNTEGI